MKALWGPSPSERETAKRRGMDPWEYHEYRQRLKADYERTFAPPPRLTSTACMMRSCGVLRAWMVPGADQTSPVDEVA